LRPEDYAILTGVYVKLDVDNMECTMYNTV